MGQKYARTCAYALFIAILVASVAAIATNNSLVLAQPCSAQLGSPSVTSQLYYGGNFQVTVPVYATCSFYPGTAYATGTAYSTAYNTNIGTANTVLSPSYGGTTLTGQLTFTLPSSLQYQSVQFSVSIYSTQNGYYGGYYGGGLLAQTSTSFVIGPTYYQGYPSYPSYPTYPTPSYPTYPYYPYYPSYPSYPYYNYYYYYGGYYYYRGYHNYCGRSYGCGRGH